MTRKRTPKPPKFGCLDVPAEHARHPDAPL